MKFTIVANKGLVENEEGKVIHRFWPHRDSAGHLTRFARDLGHEVNVVWENEDIERKLNVGDNCPECNTKGSLVEGTAFHFQNGLLHCSNCQADISAIEISKSRNQWVQFGENK